MSNEKQGLDHFADLWAGRYANNFTALLGNQQSIASAVASLNIAVLKLQKENEMSTANEQKILDAANTLTQAASALQSGVKAKEERIAQLEAKIKELGEQPPPEDLSQEFGEFDKAMADIQNLANNLTPASGGSGSGTQENVPNVSGTPITQPATETPLAGESGTTNPAVEGGGPLIDQQAPGVPVEVAPDSGNSEAPASSEEGEAPADKPADSENPFA